MLDYKAIIYGYRHKIYDVEKSNIILNARFI